MVCKSLSSTLKSDTKVDKIQFANGRSSDYLPVNSGIPQGTVLGPFMFLLYINDIDQNISSTIRLFADDCIMYRTVTTREEASSLQYDLDKIYDWCTTWQMQLNIDKCAILRCTRSPFPVLFDYMVDGRIITSTDKHPYLGITLHKTMQWSHHIDVICKKASKVLNFIRRNLSKCSIEVKSTAYFTLVRPIMEYAASVWDPHQQYLIDNIEKIQRQAARWVLSDYRQQSSVTNMLNQLHWPTLQLRCYISRLSRFIRLFTIITLLSICHPTTCLHHIQPDNYIHIDTSFRLFPPPVTSKASFLNGSVGIYGTYRISISRRTYVLFLYSKC